MYFVYTEHNKVVSMKKFHSNMSYICRLLLNNIVFRHLPCFCIKTNARQLLIKCQSSGTNRIKYICVAGFFFQSFNKVQNEPKWTKASILFNIYLNLNGDVCLCIVSIPYFTYMITIQNVFVNFSGMFGYIFLISFIILS